MDIFLLSSEGFTNLELNQASFDDLYHIPNYKASRLIDYGIEADSRRG